MDSLLHQIALTLVPQVGAITAKSLVSYCGSAEAVFRASKRELFKIPGIGALVIQQLQQPEALRRAERELYFLEQNQVEAIFYTDRRYPDRLLQAYDCPTMIYFKGNTPHLLASERILGVVGTRQPTEYGKMMCEEILEGLLDYNILVVSGLAYGIDITAHRKATALGIPNIGILGHGLGSIYPAAHASAAERMMENGGLITEYISDTKPDREHFPMRNRIIAGMCDALLVVETADMGGSMITAELAKQYNRDLFAVPGRVRDPKSAGCNLLIKENSAQLVETAEDLALAMRWDDTGCRRPSAIQLTLDLDPAETALMDRIRQQPEIHIDLLTEGINLPPGELAARLLSLEFKGAIRALPGKRYIVV